MFNISRNHDGHLFSYKFKVNVLNALQNGLCFWHPGVGGRRPFSKSHWLKQRWEDLHDGCEWPAVGIAPEHKAYRLFLLSYLYSSRVIIFITVHLVCVEPRAVGECELLNVILIPSLTNELHREYQSAWGLWVPRGRSNFVGFCLFCGVLLCLSLSLSGLRGRCCYEAFLMSTCAWGWLRSWYGRGFESIVSICCCMLRRSAWIRF